MAELSPFYKGYKHSQSLGLLKVEDGNSFLSKTARALVSLYEMVYLHKKGDDHYNRHWDKAHKNFHYWLSWDSKTDLIALYPTSRMTSQFKEDSWAMRLVDDLLEMYNYDAVVEWTSFTETEEYKESLDVVANYYATTGDYFSQYINLHRDGKKFSRQEYDRFAQNKYSTKVLSAFNADPKFSVGALADFKATHNETSDEYGFGKTHRKAPNGLLILSNTEQIVSACVGAKRYKVVAVGDSRTFYVEERYLKKRKKR